MEQWYVLRAIEKKEQEAAELLERAVDHQFWSLCRIPRKARVFRSGGALHLLNDVMFPGYVFVKTSCPKALAEELWKSRELPHFINCEKENAYKAGRRAGEKCGIVSKFSAKEAFVPLEKADLVFLKQVCGENLQNVMGVSRIVLNGDNRIIRADGVLESYLDRVVKLNLHKRFAVVEVSLFNRIQPILFGVRLPQDRAV